MERNIIVTLNSYKNYEFNNQSIESMRFAANKWNADFYEKTYFENDDLPGKKYIWGKFWLLDNFDNYDNVLYLDSDIIINSNSPSIFNQIDDSALYVVVDGNPGRFKDDYFKKNHSYVFATKANAIKTFTENIKNFNEEIYLKNYFNTGVILYNPKKFKPYFKELKEFLNKKEIINYLDNGGCDQDIMNAWFSTKDIKIKYLDNTWNWIAPDILDEYDMFLGSMNPNIYHFCGTNLAKERLKGYDRWK